MGLDKDDNKITVIFGSGVPSGLHIQTLYNSLCTIYNDIKIEEEIEDLCEFEVLARWGRKPDNAFSGYAQHLRGKEKQLYVKYVMHT